MPQVTFRNSARHVVGTCIVKIPACTLAVFAFWRSSSDWPWFWSEILLAAIVLSTVVMIFEPIWAVRFRTLTVRDDELILHTGWLVPQARRTALSNVTSIQIDEPFTQRLSGVRALTIMVSGSAQTIIEMPALRPADAALLSELLTDDSPGTATSGGQGEIVERQVSTDPGQVAGSRIYRANRLEIAATAASGGYVVALIFAGVSALSDSRAAMATIGFDLPNDGTARSVVWFLLGTVAVGSVAVMVGLKYRGFSIYRELDGRLSLSYGALERVRHTISPDQVLSISLVRTPMDFLFGTTRLALSTGSTSDGSRQRLSFPSMRRDAISAVVESSMGREIPPLLVDQGRRWATGAGLLALTSIGLVLLTADLGGLTRTIAVLASLGLSVSAVRYLFGSASANDHPDVIVRTVGISSRVTCYLPGSTKVLIERRVARSSVGSLTISGWAHRRFVHRIPMWNAESSAELRMGMRADQVRTTSCRVRALDVYSRGMERRVEAATGNADSAT